MKKGIKNSIIIGAVSILICSIGIGAFVQRNLKLSKEETLEKQAMTETKEFTEDDFPYNIKFKDIAVGYEASIALDEEGYLWTWGRNSYDAYGNIHWIGQLGDSSTIDRVYPKKISNKKFSKIYAYNGNAFAIDEEGYLYGWGKNNSYQLGDGTNTSKLILTPIKPNLYFSSIDTSDFVTAAIDENGEIWIWGYLAGSYNDVHDYFSSKYTVPTKISDATKAKFIDVAVTRSACIAIDENGNIWTYGYNGYKRNELNSTYYTNEGVLGNNNATEPDVLVNFTQITSDVVYKDIDAGEDYIIAKDEDNHLWSWGKNSYGTLGLGDINMYSVPTLITNKKAFKEMYINGNSCIAIDTNGDVYSWGENSNYQLGQGDNSYKTNITKLELDKKYKKCAISPTHSLILSEDGTLYGVGENGLGIGKTGYGSKTYIQITNPNSGYKVTFMDGENTIDTQTVEQGKSATAPEITKEGYTLSWDKEFNNVTSDLTVNAVWTPNTYTVTLNKNGGTVNSGDITSYTYGIGATLPANITKQWYVFRGWFENAECTGNAVTNITNTDIGNKTYYAKWLKDTDGDGIPDIEDNDTQVAYKVEHYVQNTNLTTYTLQETVDKVEGTNNKLTGHLGSTVTAVAKQYQGFSENQNHADRKPSGIVVDDGSLTLKLYYDRNNYTVTLTKDGGTVNSGDITSYTYGIGATLPTNITKQWYVFRGWFEQNDFSGTAVTNITNTDVGNKTYYAKWLKDTDGDGIPDIEDNDTQIPYKVEHYVQNTDLTTYTLQETETTLTGNLGSTATAVSKQYQGFSENTNHVDRVANGTVVDDGSLTLKLYYDRNNYAVSLNKDGGTINTGNILQYTYGIGAVLPTDVTKEGYVFRGWYKDAECTGNVVTEIGTQEIGTKIYYAKWLVDTDRDGIPDIEDNDTQVPYKVEHYVQNTDLTTYTLKETTDKIEGTNDKLTGNLGDTVTAVAKQYQGFSENTNHVDRVESGTVVVDGSLTLKLYYDRQTYQITYETEGGTIEDKNYVTKYTYGIIANLPTTVTKPGYTFGGWYEDIKTEEKTIVSQTKPEDYGEKTYKANWIASGNTAYKIEHYKQGENGYTLEETDNKTAQTDTTVTAVPKTYEGYIENLDHEERIANGKVKGDGSLTLKLYYKRITYEVTFKDEETIIETQTINHGESATAPEITKEGYVLRWDKEFNNVTSNLEVKAIWLRDTDGDGIPDIEDDETLVEYIVRHYKQQGDTKNYTLADTEKIQGQLGSIATAQPKQYEGYVENTNVVERIPSGEITGNETLELRLFYDTIKYEVIFKNGEEEIEKQTVPHGGTAKAPEITKEGYILSWDKDLNGIIENQTINAVWTKVEEKEIIYKIEHYVQTKEGGYSLKETEEKKGKIGEKVTAKAKIYEEYVLKEEHEGTIKEGELQENRELVLKLYYKYKKFTVIFKDGEEEVGRVEVNYGETAEPPTLTKPGYILSWDKNINNITGEQTIKAVWTKDPNYKDPNEGKDQNAIVNKVEDGKDNKRPSILPKTGEETVTLIGIITLLGLSVIYFAKYRK